ncbi:MAG: transglycosylase domain-containing protein [Treponema sp.]|nr:transglycosylase domain-containing protein [Treponema sp.]
MNKIINIILKIILRILFCIIILSILLYVCLWIYVINFTPKEYKNHYDNKIIIDLDEGQYEIIWFTLTRNNRYKVKWKPFIFDIFIEYYFREDHKNVGYLAANSMLFELNANNIPSMQWHILNYSFTRYVEFDKNWKKCLSIIITNGYYGNGVYGIINASEYYYNKKINDVTEKELISLILLNLGSNRFEIGSIISEETINEIYNLFRK